MTNILEEFWIISKDGIPYINLFKENGINSNFKSRTFSSEEEITHKVRSVLETEQETFLKKHLVFFELKNYRYIITSCLNGYLHLILKSSLDVKIKKLRNISKVIGDMIKNLYMVRDFREWEGDFKRFDNFKKKMNLYFKMSNL
ncbi:MAG: hypothetical protein ACW98X_08190 [Promethearchaeota archaeon]|jgi:hypothetical protein